MSGRKALKRGAARALGGLSLLLVAACGSDDPLTGPAPIGPQPTHLEVSVKMSSITAQQDCENTPGNPGEFRYRLIVTKRDQLDNWVTVGEYASGTHEIADGDVLGMEHEPIRFLMPLDDPDARFQVEYWVGEYDGSSADFENHGWANHIYQREGHDQEWRPGVDFQDYVELEDGEKYGIHKFSVWNTRAECKGFARYIVRWKPVVIE